MSHMTVAVSEAAFQELFNQVRDSFTFSDSDSGSWGPFSAGYSVAMHLKGGTIDLRSDNTVRVAELDVKWDTLSVWVGLDLPQMCVGGFCIIPAFWGGCAVSAPSICVFSDNPDITLPLDLSGLLTSEVSFIASPVVTYFVDPARTPSMDWLDAENAGIPNKWQIFIDPESVDIDVFDIADIVGDLLENAANAAVDALLVGLPGWAVDLIKSLIGSVIDLVRDILDIPDDIGEWLADLLGVSLGLLNTVATAVADFFAAQNPLHEIEDPLPILLASGILPPVKLPIANLSVRFEDTEMVGEADVG
jgi:hypothetical protein